MHKLSVCLLLFPQLPLRLKKPRKYLAALGVQLVGARGSDSLLLSIAEQLESSGVARHEWPEIAGT